jgi:hypothetical protein
MKNLVIVLVGIFVFLQSCKNDEFVSSEGVHDESVGQNYGLLKFASEDDYNNTKVEVANMSEEDRILWETQRGFKSFGSIAEELYSSINFDSLEGIEELNEFVSQNSNYLEFFKDDDGEMVLETGLYKSSDQYFANKDRIFQVGDKLYKVFKDVKLFTNSENIDALKAVKYEDVFANNLDNIFVIKESKIVRSLADCGTFAEHRTTNNRDRMRGEMSISVGKTTKYPSGKIQSVVINIDFWGRPYKRTLGIWYWCKRICTLGVSEGVLEYKDNYGAWKEFPYASQRVVHAKSENTSLLTKQFHAEYILYDWPDTPTSMDIRWGQYIFEVSSSDAGHGYKRCGI